MININVMVKEAFKQNKVDFLLPREKKVLEIRFGIENGIPQTLEQVGKVFSVTRERIRLIEAKAIYKIRLSMEGKCICCGNKIEGGGGE